MTDFTIESDAAFAACLKAIAAAGFGIRQSSPPSFLEVQTRNKYKAWDGVISVIITPAGNGCEITLNSAVARMDVRVGFMAVAEATGAAQMAENKLMRHISDEIMATPRTQNKKVSQQASAAPAQASSTSVLDELAKLKNLLDIGALTQDEFDSMKKKLLS
jgi:hypothetical protein